MWLQQELTTEKSEKAEAARLAEATEKKYNILAAEKQALADAASERDAVRADLETRLREIEELSARLETANSENRSLQQRAAEQDEDLKQRLQDIAALGNEILGKDHEIDELTKTAAQAETEKAERARLAEELSARSKELEDTKLLLTDIDALKAEVKTLKELMREKNQALETRNKKIKELEAD